MKKLLLFSVGVAMVAGSATSEEVVFKGARIDQSVIDQKDCGNYFSWVSARGYSIWTPQDAKLAEGYNYLTLPASWDDADISPEKDYLIKNNYSAPCAPSGSTTFNGNKLTIGEYSETEHHTTGSWSWCTDMGWLTASSGTLTFANEGAYFVNGGFWVNSLATPTFNGKITVVAPESNPFWLYAYSWSNPTFTFNAEIAGAKGTALLGQIAGGGDYYINYNFNGDMSGYYGLLDLRKGAHVAFGGLATYMPGKLKFAGNATLRPAGANNIGDLRFGALEFTAKDSVITLGVTTTENAKLRVDNSVVVPQDGTAKVNYTLPLSQMAFDGGSDNYWRMKVTNDAYRAFSLIDIPASIPSIASVFSMVDTSTYTDVTLTKLLAATYGERVDGDRRRFDVVIPKCTYQKADSTSPSPFSAGAGDKWQNRTASDPIDSETAYYIPYNISSAFPKSDYVCPAAKIIAASSVSLRQYCDLTIDGGLTLTANSIYMIPVADQGRASVALSGNLNFPRRPATDGYVEESYYGNPCLFRAERKVDVRADIHGDGVVSFMNLQSSWGFAKGNVEYVLSGDNRDFNGRMIVSHESASEGYVTTVKFGKAENLGGKTVEKLAYKAIEIRAGGRLAATNSLDFSTATHGVYVNGRGGVGVENKTDTFKLGTQLTMDGELVKSGAGTLALKGALRFTSAESETPVAGKNVLTVSEGAIRGMTVESVNGLAVKLASGAAVEVASPLESVSDDERDFGFYNVSGSFDLSEAGGKFNVRVNEGGRYAQDGSDLWPEEFSRALCTVSNGVAANLQGKFRLVDKPSRFAMKVVAVPNADGETTTFRGDFFRSGFALIVR